MSVRQRDDRGERERFARVVFSYHYASSSCLRDRFIIFFTLELYFSQFVSPPKTTRELFRKLLPQYAHRAVLSLSEQLIDEGERLARPEG